MAAGPAVAAGAAGAGRAEEAVAATGAGAARPAAAAVTAQAGRPAGAAGPADGEIAADDVRVDPHLGDAIDVDAAAVAAPARAAVPAVTAGCRQ